LDVDIYFDDERYEQMNLFCIQLDKIERKFRNRHSSELESKSKIEAIATELEV
jgi:hypothetical protein